jgi:DNA-binding transcriptional ArsR family regulator
MSHDNVEVKVKFIRGFADRTRLQILAFLEDQKKNVSQIMDELKVKKFIISYN